MTKARAAATVRAYWRCALRGPDDRRGYHLACVAYWAAIWRQFCPDCDAPLGDGAVCAGCAR